MSSKSFGRGATPSPISGGPEPDKDLVKKLTSLGIREASAKYALKRMGGDVQKAADFVFSGNAGRDEVSDVDPSTPSQTPSPPLNRTPGPAGMILRGTAAGDGKLSDSPMDGLDDDGARKESAVTWADGVRRRSRGSDLHDPTSSPRSSSPASRSGSLPPSSPGPPISPVAADLLMRSPIIAPSTLAGSTLGTIPEHVQVHETPRPSEDLEEPPEFALDGPLEAGAADAEAPPGSGDGNGGLEGAAGIKASSVPGSELDLASLAEDGSVSPSVDLSETTEASTETGGDARPRRRMSSGFGGLASKIKAKMSGSGSPSLDPPPSQTDYATLRKSALKSNDSSPGLLSSLTGRKRALRMGRSTSLPTNNFGLTNVTPLPQSPMTPSPSVPVALPDALPRDKRTSSSTSRSPPIFDTPPQHANTYDGSTATSSAHTVMPASLPLADSPPMDPTPASAEPQTESLIMKGLSRGNSDDGKSDQSTIRPALSPTTSTFASVLTPVKAPTMSGALAALGLKAGAVGAPTEASSKPVIVQSQPVGSTTPPVLNPPANEPDSTITPSASGSSVFGTRATSRGRGNDSKPSTNADAGLTVKSKSASRRSRSPFFRSRKRSSQIVDIGSMIGLRSRDNSPDGGAIAGDADSDGESVVSNSSNRYRPQTGSSFDSHRRTSSYGGSDGEDSDSEEDPDTDVEYDEHLSTEVIGPDGWVEDVFDEETEKNTEANAVYIEGDGGGLGGPSNLDEGDENEVELDITGEGPNVVRPPEPVFAFGTSQMQRRSSADPDGAASSKRRKSTYNERLPLETGRPEYGRNNCTIRLTHGEPDQALERSGNRLRSYVVLSDLSQESNIALTWAIGTVARDGDEVFVTTVMETDTKVDPKDAKDMDRATKLRLQKERSSHALLLVKQVTGLLQRTRLNITVTCQAIHSKNARHMLLDLIDYIEPTMVIVGSRGLGKLRGIILGSTSRYLIEKSSVPVMVARRRLRAPLRKTDPATLRHAPRVSLASASIEKSAPTKQEDEIIDAADIEAEEDEKVAKERAAAAAAGRATVGGEDDTAA